MNHVKPTVKPQLWTSLNCGSMTLLPVHDKIIYIFGAQRKAVREISSLGLAFPERQRKD